MDEQLINLIKKNKGILRQLTNLNNRVKKLEKTKKELVYSIENFKPIIESFEMQKRRGFEIIPGIDMSEEEIAKIKVGGTDPD